MAMTKGSVHLGLFLVYLFASGILLMGAFKLAAHRKYFFHLVPFVVAYAALAAFLLRSFNLQEFLWWYLAVSSVFFFVNLRRHLRSKDAIDAFAHLQQSVAESIPEGEIRQEAAKELSPDRQVRQQVVIAVTVFIVSFVLTFYLVNGGI